MVIVPYVHLHPATEMLARLYDARLCWTGCGHDHYLQTLDYFWRHASGLVVVEQDILPWGVGRLLVCPRPWCTRPYRAHGYRTEGLGLVRFSAGLMREHPDLILDSADIDPPSSHWRNLGARIAWMLHNVAGVERHVHLPTWHFH